MSADNTTRKGKIARLPRAIREALNERLLDGETAPEVLPWLNALPEVMAEMQQHWKGEPVNEQNLSAWRQGGYADWCDDQAETEEARSDVEFAMKMVEATGLQLTDGAAQVAAGKLMMKIRRLRDEDAATPEEEDANEARAERLERRLAVLRSGDHTARSGQLEKSKVELKRGDQDLKKRAIILQEEKFKRLLVEKLIETASKPEVQRILQSGKPKAVQMDLMHKLLFGEEEDVAA